VFSQAQYDEGVRNAAKQAATDAVKHLRDLDKETKNENEELLKKIGQVKKPKDEALEVEKAIKVAVTMEAGDIDAKVKGSDDYLKSPITGVGIMNQMKQAHADPVGNKLNAATAAGIEMARQTL